MVLMVSVGEEDENERVFGVFGGIGYVFEYSDVYVLL